MQPVWDRLCRHGPIRDTCTPVHVLPGPCEVGVPIPPRRTQRTHQDTGKSLALLCANSTTLMNDR